MVELEAGFELSIRDLFEHLRKILTNAFALRWNRALPVSEALSDRWKRAELLGFGRGTSVYDNSYFYGLNNITVGNDCWFGPMTVVDGSGASLKIGRGCSISSGAMIFTHSAHRVCVNEGKGEFDKAPVVIEDHVFIGSGAVVLPGVRIGHHSIIGANAVVTEDIPPESTAVGIPAKVIKK